MNGSYGTIEHGHQLESNFNHGNIATLEKGLQQQTEAATELLEACDKQSEPAPKSTGTTICCCTASGEARSSTAQEDIPPRNQSYIGLVYVILSAICFSLQALGVKILLPNFHPLPLAAYRFAGLLLPSMIIVLINKQNIFPQGKRLVLLSRGFFGTLGLLSHFYTLQYLPLVDASVILFSTPVFCSIFAWTFLKESCGLFQAVLVAVTVSRVVLISQPTFIFTNHSTADVKNKNNQAFGVAIACFGVILSSLVYIILRSLKGVHYSVIILNFSIIALCITIISACSLGVFQTPQNIHELLIVAGIGVASFLGQYFITNALALVEAGPVSIVRTSEIVFAFIWQLLFFHQVPSSLTCIGGFLVISCVILTGFRKILITLDQESTLRKMFWVLEK